ncbi:Basic region leucine zipper [Gracilaria domingensis]|nr:Basic region leucine zipper [Gracilaria domingensis]
MEDVPFHDLHHAAIAGAEGTAWTIPEFSECPPVPAMYSDFHPSSPALDSFSIPFTPSAPIPIPIKEEPTRQQPIPCSPPQPSSCSLSSQDSFARCASAQPCTPPNQLTIRPLPTSPVSILDKPAASSSSSPSLAHNELSDLKGTTAARSRKMTEHERRIMLHKRRLRNRASAARSREKRSRTLIGLSAEVEQLMKQTAMLAEKATQAVEEARRLKAHNVMLVKENELLKAELNM